MINIDNDETETSDDEYFLIFFEVGLNSNYRYFINHVIHILETTASCGHFA